MRQSWLGNEDTKARRPHCGFFEQATQNNVASEALQSASEAIRGLCEQVYSEE
jgi:hypothetical protein